MSQKIDAIYENGVLRPLAALRGIPEQSRVRLTVEPAAGAGARPADCAGSLPDEDAAEMRRIIAREFERVDPHDW